MAVFAIPIMVERNNMTPEKLREYKGYRVEALGTFALVKIKAKGQGSIPDKLSGNYTSYAEAFKAIDIYLNSLLKKGKARGTTENSGTD